MYSDPCILPFWTEALESPVISDCSFSAAAVLREFRFVAFEKANPPELQELSLPIFVLSQACLACSTIENYYPYSRSIITPKPYSGGTLLRFGNNLQKTIILESYSGGTLLLLENAYSMQNDDIFDHTRGYSLCTQYNPIAEAVIRAFYPFGRKRSIEKSTTAVLKHAPAQKYSYSSCTMTDYWYS